MSNGNPKAKAVREKPTRGNQREPERTRENLVEGTKILVEGTKTLVEGTKNQLEGTKTN